MARIELGNKPTATAQRGTARPAELGMEPCPHCGTFVVIRTEGVAAEQPHQCDMALEYAARQMFGSGGN